MYWSKQEKRVSHKQLKALNPEDKITQLNSFISKNKALQEWKSAICYVLKYEECLQQFTLLEQLYLSMQAINKGTLANVLYELTDEYKLCKSLGAFYLSMKYLVEGKSYIKTTSTLKKIYSALVDKYALYEQEITDLQGVPTQSYPSKLVQEISAAVECLPKLFETFGDRLDSLCIPVILGWAVIYPQQTKEQIRYLNDFCKYVVKDVCQKSMHRQSNVQLVTTMLVTTINRCSFNYPEAIPDDIIDNLDQAEDIILIDVDHIIQAFLYLTKAAVTQKVLRLIYSVSFGLKRDEDYFALNKIYKEFIIPRLIKDAKATQDGQTILRNIVDFYVNGFLGWSTIVKEDLRYFVDNYQLISRKNMTYWLQKAYLACNSNPELLVELKTLTKEIVTGEPNEALSDKQYNQVLQGAWEIIQDDLLHQRKKYTFTKSKLTGIRNTSSTCYIISAMQALFMTKSLPELLKNYSKEMIETTTWDHHSSKIKLKFLYELNALMNELKQGKPFVKADYVKMYGPPEFKNLQGQQDSHEYLIQLFDCMEKELAKMNDKAKDTAIAHFKNLFELGITSNLTCENCKIKQQHMINTNIHSIGCQEKLQLSWVDHVDHKCDSCGSTNPRREQSFRMVKLPQILLVHLKRFEFKHDTSIKKLDQGEIPRKFQGYKLMGFISHIGRNSLCGHYVLYCRKEDNPEVWYEFNDEKVFEFRPTNENQPFEKNFKLSNTPYILIYQQKKV